MSKEEEFKAMLKKMLIAELKKMSPEEREKILNKMRKQAYNLEVNAKLWKHKKILSILATPIVPLSFLLGILKIVQTRKEMAKQLLALGEAIKKYSEIMKVSGEEPKNLISPERKAKKQKKVETPIS